MLLKVGCLPLIPMLLGYLNNRSYTSIYQYIPVYTSSYTTSRFLVKPKGSELYFYNILFEFPVLCTLKKRLTEPRGG